MTKGGKSAWKGEWENVMSGKQLDTVQEETLAVFATGIIVDNEHSRPLLLQRAQTRIEGRKPSRGTGTKGESFSGRKGSERRAKITSKGTCTNPSCKSWPPSACENLQI